MLLVINANKMILSSYLNINKLKVKKQLWYTHQEKLNAIEDIQNGTNKVSVSRPQCAATTVRGWMRDEAEFWQYLSVVVY